MPSKSSAKMTIDMFMAFYCNQFGISKQQLRTRSRIQRFCFYRHGYCAMASYQGFGPSEIGNSIGRNHSTVIKSIDRHFELITDRKYRKILKIKKA